MANVKKIVRVKVDSPIGQEPMYFIAEVKSAYNFKSEPYFLVEEVASKNKYTVPLKDIVETL